MKKYMPTKFKWLAAGAVAALAVGPFLNADAATVSPMLRHQLRDGLSEAQSPAMRADEDAKYLPLIIKLNNPGVALPPEVTVLHQRGDFVLAYVPVGMIDEIEESGIVSRMEGRAAAVPAMDVARTFTGLSQIGSTADVPRELTGKNVVVGFSDIGFDPSHINFRDPATGENRVKRLVSYDLTPEKTRLLNTPDEIDAWLTDDDTMWHATHVAGIMAGSDAVSGYRGIASDAEIVATTSPLYDALLLAGMEEVVDYAQSVGKPAVINMSVSSGIGPRDGSSLFSQYLELLSQEATVCIASGNDGRRRGRVYGTFPEACSTGIRVCDYPSLSPSRASGYVDIWSTDASPLCVRLLVYDRNTDGVVWSGDFSDLAMGNDDMEFTITTSSEILQEIGADPARSAVSTDLGRYLSGAVSIAMEVSPNNGRFNALVASEISPAEEGGVRYMIGVEIIGKAGQSFEAYASDHLFANKVENMPQFTVCTTDGVINDFITGKGVIGVGAMCSRTSWPLLAGGEDSNDGVVGRYSDFSSFASSSPKGALPDVVAPGQGTVSSISSHYLNSNPDFRPLLVAETEDDGKKYYWASCQGTSMAAPYVAGVCALMLEANPDLTPAEVKEIVMSTLATPTIEKGNIRWGKGILDSYACVRKAMSLASIGGVAADDPDGHIKLISKGDGRYEVMTADGPVKVEAYSIDGRTLLRRELGGDVREFALPGGASPVIIRVETRQGSAVFRRLQT